MDERTGFALAAIQATPVYFDREASTEKACQLIREAGARGAALAAFGESWLPGYPFFLWGSSTGSMAAAYLEAAVEIPSDTTDRLGEAARQGSIDVVIGVAERDALTHGTVYCTLLFIGSDGEILGRHRKLKPTGRERTAWGEGDGSSLSVYQRPYGMISGLNCWEHNMPLPGYVLMAQGSQIHVAAWPGMSSSRHLFVSRAFASQAAAYVIDVGGLLSPDDITGAFADVTVSYPGQSCIISPTGRIIAGPAEGECILMADCSAEDILRAKATCDVAGHYSRPDVFQLHVNRSRRHHVVVFEDSHQADASSQFESEYKISTDQSDLYPSYGTLGATRTT
jgi:nitrilase